MIRQSYLFFSFKGKKDKIRLEKGPIITCNSLVHVNIFHALIAEVSSLVFAPALVFASLVFVPAAAVHSSESMVM